MRVSVLALPIVLLMTACNNAGPEGSSSAQSPAAADQTIIGIPAAGSKFARVRIGMSKKEIEDIIGNPTDQNTHLTGKAFIPFYFGSGTAEVYAYYKGEGILSYLSRNSTERSFELTQIKVDPQEGGSVH